MASSNLFKKFLTFSYGSIIGLVIGFFTTLLSTHLLSPEDFGKASMFTLAVNISALVIIFGTDQSFIRFFYEEKEENRGKLLYNCIRLPIVMTFAVGILFLLFQEKLSYYLFGINSNSIIGLLLIGVVAQVMLRYGQSVIRMQQKGNIFSIIQILNRVLQLVFLVLVYLIIGPEFEIIVYSTVITLLLLSIVAIVFERKFWSLKNLSNEKVKHSKNEIFTYGYPLVITLLITWLFQSFDKLAIRQWSSFEELGLYAAAFKIVALLTVVQGAFTTFWTPVCYEKFEKNPDDKEFFARTSKLIALTMFFIAIVTIMFKDLIIMMLGADFSGAGDILPFLVFIPLLYTISETTVIGINFYKKPKWHIAIAAIACIVNIFGNWLLVPPYGGAGAAIATAGSYIVFLALRTGISQLYYKVNYRLVKMYVMISLVTVYAFISITIESIIVNVLIGAGLLLVNAWIYVNELVVVYKQVTNRKKG
ncbi:lipopolysaccharide biosynthesis protein [Virgibacillus flavescens]|uniref:lipopolysaccharide biosynthesis protein n=1 Tax=Virgibacillus flavescens TaxID=1611422 RepID=UPI003D3522D3